MENRKIVILTGAGMSAESGISTFRDSDGLWEHYPVQQVASIEGYEENPELVLNFYNARRKELLNVKPNHGHLMVAALEKYFNVTVITQNVDNLHERAGSTNVTHLHGEIRKLRSSINETATVPIEGWEQKYDTRHPDGSLLRPYVVFFGENVPMLERAIEITHSADLMIVVGTSLQVYPAASLVHRLRPGTPIYIIDPNTPNVSLPNLHVIREPASVGVPQLVDELLGKDD